MMPTRAGMVGCELECGEPVLALPVGNVDDEVEEDSFDEVDVDKFDEALVQTEPDVFEVFIRSVLPEVKPEEEEEEEEE